VPTIFSGLTHSSSLSQGVLAAHPLEPPRLRGRESRSAAWRYSLPTIFSGLTHSSSLSQGVLAAHPLEPPRLRGSESRSAAWRYSLPTIFSGFTHSSNCSGVTSPSSTAVSFSVLPVWWAVFAILAALS